MAKVENVSAIRSSRVHDAGGGAIFLQKSLDNKSVLPGEANRIGNLEGKMFNVHMNKLQRWRGEIAVLDQDKNIVGDVPQEDNHPVDVTQEDVTPRG